jgi:hypothetical protein
VHIPIRHSEEVTSQSVVIFAGDGGRVRPTELVLAEGPALPLISTDSLTPELGYRVASDVAQITIPALPGGPFREVVAISVETEFAERVCVKTYRRRARGELVHLNIYVNTLTGMDAESARRDRGVMDVLSQLQTAFQGVDIRLSITIRDLPERTAEQYRLVRNDSDAGRLVASAPGPPDVETLSLNVFLVESLVVNNNVILGISRGIPGAAGMHGSGSAGVIADGSSLIGGRSSGYRLGLVVAHEIGHFLGLYHTTEANGRWFDPLDDTPRCSIESSDWARHQCPDRTNLMWPIAGTDTSRLTRDQGWVLSNHPLARSN